eukprot:tig00000076_g2347.t1
MEAVRSQSFLDVIQERIQRIAEEQRQAALEAGLNSPRAAKKHLVNRMVIAAREADPTWRAEDFAEHFNEYIAHASQGEELPLTGILLLYNGAALAVVEASPRFMMTLAKEMATKGKTHRPATSYRILLNTDEVAPVFPPFSQRPITMSAGDDVPEGAAKDVMPHVQRTILCMLALARALQTKRNREEVDAEFEMHMRARSADSLLPTGALLSLMAGSEDLCTPDDYVTIYSPIGGINLDSERVFPMPAPLRY